VSDLVRWHDIECGAYDADLPLWRELAAAGGGPVLDVGCGTGRVALPLAADGFEVTGLDHEPALLEALRQRAGDLRVDTVAADARDFALPGPPFALILVPMQTVQLLGGPAGRGAFLACARRHLRPGGLLAAALAEELVAFDAGSDPLPPPDVREEAGWLYASQPVAVEAHGARMVLRRMRETVAPDGALTREDDRIELDEVDAGELAREGAAAGLTPLPPRRIPPTEDHVGSRVVMLGG